MKIGKKTDILWNVQYRMGGSALNYGLWIIAKNIDSANKKTLAFLKKTNSRANLIQITSVTEEGYIDVF